MVDPKDNNDQKPIEGDGARPEVLPDGQPENRLQPGETFDAYIIERFLGRGGMGEVYQVRHQTLDSRYAIKVLPPSFAKRQDALDRFQNEARIMSRLNHPNIVRVDDFRLTEGLYWLRMELAQGDADGAVTLQDLADRSKGVVPQKLLLWLMQDVISGVAYAHSLGVVHRDLKPANILLFPGISGELQAKVSDYGLVKMMGEEYHRSQVTSVLSLSQTGSNPDETEEDTFNRALIGTWEYMSPEQQEAGDVGPGSDVYALGLIMYRLLTGRKLSPWPPSHYDPSISKNMDVFVLRALEPEPADRYENAGRMLDVCRDFFHLDEDDFQWNPNDDRDGADRAEHTAPVARERLARDPRQPLETRNRRYEPEAGTSDERSGTPNTGRVDQDGPGDAGGRGDGFGAGVQPVEKVWHHADSQRVAVDLQKARLLAEEGNWDDAIMVLNALKMVIPDAHGVETELRRLQTLQHEQQIQELQTAAIKNESRSQMRTLASAAGIVLLLVVFSIIFGIGYEGKTDIMKWLPWRFSRVEKSTGTAALPTRIRTRPESADTDKIASGEPAAIARTGADDDMRNTADLPAGLPTAGIDGREEDPVARGVDDSSTPGGDTAPVDDDVARIGGDHAAPDAAAKQGPDTEAVVQDADAGSSPPAAAATPKATAKPPSPEPTVKKITSEPPDVPVVTATPEKKDPFAGSIRKIPDLGTELVLIRPGEFLMGSEQEGPFERPVHYVKMTEPYWIGRRETTLAEFRIFMIESGNNRAIDWSDSRCPFQSAENYPLTGFKYGQMDTQPVVLVSWFGAIAFCDWLTERELSAGRLPPGYRYRLPTEAEWEYAARAGTVTHYPWGDTFECNRAMAENDAGSSENRCTAYYRSRRLSVSNTAPTGSFSPNMWGLFDTSGNVWEWCRDWFDPAYYGRSAKTNPAGPETGTERVIRGGAWINNADKCTSSFRGSSDPSRAHGTIGFRVVLGK